MDTLRIPRKSQGGFILVMTLVILVVITLSSIAMMLSAKAGLSAAGNIAFRQAATRTADVAAETAMTWVGTQINGSATALDTSSPANGYYAVHDAVDAVSNCDPTGGTTFRPEKYDFGNASCAKALASQVSGYSLYYVIHRMASSTGTCPGAGCMAPPPADTSSAAATPAAGASVDADAAVFSSTTTTASDKTVYYRITVKVAGPRRNTRYVQTFIY